MASESGKLTATEQLTIIILFCFTSMFIMVSMDLLFNMYASQDGAGAITTPIRHTHKSTNQACCSCCELQGCTEGCRCEMCIE